jgi:hypothetical protein
MPKRLSTKLNSTLEVDGAGKYGVAASVQDLITSAGTAASAASTAASAASTAASAANTAASAASTAASTAQSTANAAVPKSLYDANSLLTADLDNTPAALIVPASTIVGRKASGGIAAISVAEALTLLQVLTETTSDARYVAKSLFDANTLLYATSDNTPVALTLPASTIVGRKSSGGIVALTAAEVLAIIGLSTAAGSKPLYVPPGTPEAIDEEFDSTTMPGGWTWRDITNAADRTPSFNSIDMFSTLTGTASPRVALHTDWRASWMMWQVADAGYHYATKPIGTVPTNACYWSRIRLPWLEGNAANPSRMQLIIAADSSGKVDPLNQICVGPFNVGGVPRISSLYYFNSASPIGQEDSEVWGANSPPPEYFAIQKFGTTYFCHFASEAGAGRCSINFNVSFTPAHIGWRVIAGPAGSQFPVAVFGVDFLRRLTGSKLPW